MSAVETSDLGVIQETIFGSRDVRILPFDLERLAELKDGFPHIWHGSVDGRIGVYATFRGVEAKTHLVME